MGWLRFLTFGFFGRKDTKEKLAEKQIKERMKLQHREKAVQQLKEKIKQKELRKAEKQTPPKKAS